MDVRFENRVTLTVPLATEFIWAQVKGLRILAWSATAVYAIWILGQIILLLADPTAVFDRALCFGGACGLAYVWCYPRLCARKAVKQFEKASGAAMPEIAVCFGDAIESHEADGVKQYTYGDIQAVHSLKHCYVLIVGKNMGLPIKRDGFTKGNFGELKQFLRQKRPDLTIPE